jgi:hypothetical protein
LSPSSELLVVNVLIPRERLADDRWVTLRTRVLGTDTFLDIAGREASTVSSWHSSTRDSTPDGKRILEGGVLLGAIERVEQRSRVGREGADLDEAALLGIPGDHDLVAGLLHLRIQRRPRAARGYRPLTWRLPKSKKKT